jgi:hypothetical protein
LGEHFFTLSEFCLVCQAFRASPFGLCDKFSQKIVATDQASALEAVAECFLAPQQACAIKTSPGDVMSQKLVFGFPIPVVLAFAVLVLLLLAVLRVLAAMRKPAPVHAPAWPGRERLEAFDPDDETLFRLGRLEITPLGERGRHLR